ncbi:Gldg family protein [Chondromyces crocatus]|uniref:ABC transporter n=1 Tax=Chondromyces crocatus TaxID=52 RepID=A0A0K1EGN3_CHOCO|nr:Gldg family protein [Chondromyces crocatus]AKT39842.1 ABC transporter [Chondromyces crocatus]
MKDEKDPKSAAADEKASAKAAETKAPVKAHAAPAAFQVQPGAWMVPAYLGALLLLFLGERVVPTFDAARYTLSGIGVALVALVTALRFVAALRERGERAAIERALALLSLLGLVAIGLYFSTTDTGRALLGVAKAAPETRARIHGATTVGWIGLLVVATLPMFFGELALAPMRRAPQLEGRRVRAATLSAMALSFAAVYTALFVYAAGELDIKADFSYFRTSRASESTLKVAQSLTEPVKVTAFFPQLNEVGVEVEGYLRELAKGAPSLEVEVQDRLVVPALAKEAKVTQDGVIVLTRGPARELVTVGADIKTAAAKLKTLDADFQKALLKVVRSQRTAYFTVGHGELNEATGAEAKEGRSAKNLRKLLESQNYVVKDLGLGQGLGSEIPKDAFLVIVLGPAKALLPEEVAALKRFADEGGKLLMGLDPDAKVDLDPLAEIVGLTWKPTPLANDKVYVRRRYNDADRSNLVSTRYSSHASVSTLSRNAARAPTLFPGVSSLDKREGGSEKVDFTIKSMGETFEDPNGNFTFDADGEKRSTYNLAAAVSKEIGGEGNDKKELRAFVVADADALSDAAFGNDPNVVLVLDAIRWLGGEESFAGTITTAEDARIEHTKEKDQLWFWGTIALGPAVVLGLGLIVTRRGRRGRSA